MLSMSALKLSNPVIFSVGMVADNPPFHANVIARGRAPAPAPETDIPKQLPSTSVRLWKCSGGCLEGRSSLALG